MAPVPDDVVDVVESAPVLSPALSPALESLRPHVPLEVLLASMLAEARAIEARETPRSSDWLAGVFQRIGVEARAIPELKVRVVDTDVPLLSSGVIQRITKIAGLRPIFAHFNHPLAPIDEIEAQAIAASDASATHVSREAPSPDAALLDAGMPMLELCKQEGGILVARGYVEASEFEGLSGRRSFLNHSVAFVRYARVFEEHWEDLVEMKSKLTKEDIAMFFAHAHRLSDIVALRANEPKAEVRPPADMSARTYTLFATSYDELESSLKYIFRHAPEWIGEYLPTKPRKPSAKAKKPTAAEEKPPQKDDADGPQPTSNGETRAPVKTSSGSVPAPVREEGRAAE